MGMFHGAIILGVTFVFGKVFQDILFYIRSILSGSLIRGVFSLLVAVLVLWGAVWASAVFVDKSFLIRNKEVVVRFSAVCFMLMRLVVSFQLLMWMFSSEIKYFFLFFVYLVFPATFLYLMSKRYIEEIPDYARDEEQCKIFRDCLLQTCSISKRYSTG